METCGVEVEQTGEQLALFAYALLLYRKGEVEKAAAVLEKHQGDQFLDVLLCFVLVELPDGAARARRVCEQLAARDSWGWSIVKPTGI